MNIYLLRHGERLAGTENTEQLGLSENGFQQAELLGKRLAKVSFDRLYSSNSFCAIQTADILSRYLMLGLYIRHDLREIETGSFRRGWEFINEFHPDFAEKFSERTGDIQYPGGECGLDVLLRTSNVMNEILESGSENVAVVTHEETISILICGMLGLNQARRFLLGSPIENGSISIIRYDKKSSYLNLKAFNDTAHLEVL